MFREHFEPKRAREKLAGMQNEIDAWRELSLSTSVCFRRPNVSRGEHTMIQIEKVLYTAGNIDAAINLV